MDEAEDVSSDDSAEIRPAGAVFTLGPNNHPIPIYLHDSLGKGGKEAIAKKIKEGGGHVTADEDDAEVIICRDDRPAFKQLVHKYDHFRYVWVEPPSWVDSCLRRRIYAHELPGRASKTNRNGVRVNFTPEDDKHLAQFLALRLPFKEMAGRTGNGVYKDLVSPDRAHLYPWAHRHPWMSWRERYKTNQDIFDRAIERIVNKEADPPKLGGKGQYTIARRGKAKFNLRHIVGSDEDLASSDELQEEDDVKTEEDPTQVPQKRPAPKQNPRRRRDAMSIHKKGRFYEDRRESEESEEEIGDGINHGDKGKGRQGSDYGHASPHEDLNLDDPFFHEVPGPSQLGGARIGAATSPPRTAPANTVSQPPASKVIFPSASGSSTRISPPPQNRPASQSERYTGQLAQAEGPGVGHGSPTAPLDTQVTLVQPSPPRGRPARAAHREAPASPPPDRYPNTRSRLRPASEPVAPPQPPKRPRGRTRMAQPPRPPSPSPVREPSQMGSLPVRGVASAVEEARVEELLQDEGAVGGGSGGRDDGTPSSDDQAAEQELLAGQRDLISASSRARSPGQDHSAGLRPSLDPPEVRLRPLAKAATPQAKAFLRDAMLNNQGSSAPRRAPDPASSPTPKAASSSKAAKKVAARDVPLFAEESEEEEQSEEQSETTGTPFPAELTDAYEFKGAKAPFRPSPGTRAERYTRNTAKRAKRLK